MRIHSLSYENIGPFENRLISCDILGGSHLIQSPIGSGKSFLFFDGPLFGLYKHRSRPILNKKSKKGRVQILFSTPEGYRLVERSISPTKKGGESVSSKLRSYDGDPENIHQEAKQKTGEEARIIHAEGTHLSEKFKKEITPIESTSSKETDQTILDLLPPKEVTLSVNFLVQESTSVFELAPAERVQVFKHLFGLLGIDVAKDRISDARKDVSTAIKISGEFSAQTSKLRAYLEEIYSNWTKLRQIRFNQVDNEGEGQASEDQSLKTSGRILSQLSSIENTPFFQDLELIKQNVNMDEFVLGENEYAGFQELLHISEEQLNLLAQDQGKEEQLRSQIRQIQASQSALMKEKQALSQQLESLQQQKSTENASFTSDLEKLQETKSTCESELKIMESELPYDAFESFGKPLSQIGELSSTLVQILQEGKHLSGEKTAYESSYEKELSDQERVKEQLSGLLDQKTQLQTAHEKQQFFECDKIQGPCPYVDLINKNALSALDTQLEKIEAQETSLQENVKSLAGATVISGKKISDLESKIQKIKEFLKAIERKKLQSLADDFEKKRQEKEKIQEEIQALQHAALQEQANKEKRIKLNEQFLASEQQLVTLGAELSALEKKQERFTKTQIPEKILRYKQIQQYAQSLQLTCGKVQELLKDFNASRLKLKTLQERELILKDLHKVFSKELMIVVLQDFLPTLEQVINSYLAKIVSYEVRFLQPQADEDISQLELDIEIVDEKGARRVKSLSGGQKTILKLVWMLAITSMFRSSFLFLDETINNLDADTIAQVAEVLEDFVRHQELSFYVVTHSPQIQQMNIWESVVEVV